jgi:hypothetical protein
MEEGKNSYDVVAYKINALGNSRDLTLLQLTTHHSDLLSASENV